MIQAVEVTAYARGRPAPTRKARVERGAPYASGG